MTDDSPTVFVIDDDPSIRGSLSLLLASAGFDVKTFASANEFLKLYKVEEGPSCMVLDVQMKGLSGLGLQEELTNRGYTIPIVFITGHGDIAMSVQAMKSGAVEFLTKPFDDDELLSAVNEALLKDSKAHASREEQQQIMKKLGSLTTREHEILTYLITGMLNKQIAYELKISERTVKAHRKQVLNKMGVSSIAALVRLTEKAGVLPADSTF